MSNIPLEEIAKKLLEEDSVLLSTHVSPDPDAIGSSFGLALALMSLKKRVFVHLQDPLPERLRSFVVNVPFGSEVPSEEFAAFVVVDTASKRRVGVHVETCQAKARRTYNIDHHVSNDCWGDLNSIDAEAAASAQIVSRLIPMLGTSISPDCANLLYAGLLDDTGGFCFSNSSAAAFRCAAALVEAGADPGRIANELYFTQPLRVLKLHASALDALKVVLDGRVAYMTISNTIMSECGALPEDAEGLVDLARRLGGTDAAVLQREIEGGWKLSLRAKRDSLDVNRVAGAFGGGGHRAAAGCKLVGTAEEVERQVLERLAVELDQ
ncbi:MAG: DHH family phosphoesterase [Bdellovibrionota bacterium]